MLNGRMIHHVIFIVKNNKPVIGHAGKSGKGNTGQQQANQKFYG